VGFLLIGREAMSLAMAITVTGQPATTGRRWVLWFCLINSWLVFIEYFSLDRWDFSKAYSVYRCPIRCINHFLISCLSLSNHHCKFLK
jgi:hypothetical protein